MRLEIKSQFQDCNFLPAFPYIPPMPYAGIPFPYGQFPHYKPAIYIPPPPIPIPGVQPIQQTQATQFHFQNWGLTITIGFQNIQESELEEAGMKRGHARALTSSFQRFERNLKSSLPIGHE
ncbi:hypothetical protein VP01_1650g6 [Puccinia sorghi]|uniref:Uncharacterized protein n=1 Tax=Puccinia sorghi TaxID=27349 RepID=A0A0L6VH45_9BASI|nr:hypothetical protein VP01_1650g6 [Puccinia sorghi]